MSELARLHPDDMKAIIERSAELRRPDPRDANLIADAVAERVRAETPSAGRLLTAAEIGERVGVGTEWVRKNGARLGGVKLGAGRNAPWRFDPAKAIESLAAFRATGRSTAPSPTRRRRPAARTATGAPLLPIREPAEQRKKER